MVTDSSAAPFYSLYQNAIGARVSAPASTFPEEAYDFGVREAVRAIAVAAQPGAAIVSDVPRIVQHYADETTRADLQVRSFSRQGLGKTGEQWVFVLPEHVYFEIVGVVNHLRSHATPWREYRMRDATVLQVFRLSY